MKPILVAMALMFGLQAQAMDHSPGVLRDGQMQGFPNTLGSKDFFTLISTHNSKPRHSQDLPQQDCRANIRQVICLVEPALENERSEDRKCLDGGLAYAPVLEALYDNYPPLMQKMFCSMKHIFIETRFFGTAYAGQIKDPNGQPTGAMIGIRKSVLDEALGLQQWASWKEQLSFGGHADSYTLTPGLPMIATSTSAKVNDFLYFVLSHEIGHLFDFANDLNQQVNCPEPAEGEEYPECQMAEGSWGSLSWLTDRTPKPEYEFAGRQGLCFYACEGRYIAAADIQSVYEGLAISNFISTYATTEPWDDFADSLAYYLMFHKLDSHYALLLPTGESFDVMEKLKSPLFKAKHDYIENFLNRSDIKYP